VHQKSKLKLLQRPLLKPPLPQPKELNSHVTLFPS
jgi:hypothetical protein